MKKIPNPIVLIALIVLIGISQAANQGEKFLILEEYQEMI